MMFGQEVDGPNDFGAGQRRFMKHPAFGTDDDLPSGFLFKALCDDYSVDPKDPAMCDKVNLQLAAADAARRAAALDADRELIKLCTNARKALVRERLVERQMFEVVDRDEQGDGSNVDLSVAAAGAERAYKRAFTAVRRAIERIVDLQATTMAGLAAKALLVTMAKDQGFDDEMFDRLALAVAADTVLAAATQVRTSHPRSKAGARLQH